MKAWRVMLMALSFLMLNGCLVTFNEAPLVAETAPRQLLGKWVSKDAWGQARNLLISAIDKQHYQAVVYPKGEPKAQERYRFIVARHGSRWYASAALPPRLGGSDAISSFMW